ncbi:unnamed protein product, partial [Acidithrix sp. C25]
VPRFQDRALDELRPSLIERDFTQMALGSALISVGKTKVLCTASMEDRAPAWLRGSGKGWVTAEYSLLPGSTPERSGREASKGKQSGRTLEIQRLIGRSLRSVVDMSAIPEIQLVVDCDVLQADGGTRTASIVGGFVALSDAINRLIDMNRISKRALIGQCAAVSVGIVDEIAMLDLDYSEDVRADVDMNVVMTSDGKFVEVQGTGERTTYSKSQLDDMLSLAEHGISYLMDLQNAVLSDPPKPRSK